MKTPKYPKYVQRAIQKVSSLELKEVLEMTEVMSGSDDFVAIINVKEESVALLPRIPFMAELTTLGQKVTTLGHEVTTLGQDSWGSRPAREFGPAGKAVWVLIIGSKTPIWTRIIFPILCKGGSA